MMNLNRTKAKLKRSPPNFMNQTPLLIQPQEEYKKVSIAFIVSLGGFGGYSTPQKGKTTSSCIRHSDLPQLDEEFSFSPFPTRPKNTINVNLMLINTPAPNYSITNILDKDAHENSESISTALKFDSIEPYEQLSDELSYQDSLNEEDSLARSVIQEDSKQISVQK